MADHLEAIDESTSSPCCNQWKGKLLKLQQRLKKTDEARAALKKAIGLYERQFDVMQDTNLKLKKAYEEEKLQTELERNDKEKESAARVSLEIEVSALKSELSSSGQKGGTVLDDAGDELMVLQGRVSESEKEINCLKERLQKEISGAAADSMKAVEEKKRADEAWERSKADKTRLVEEMNKLKAQLNTVEMEKEQLRKDLQKESDRADSEKKRADEALKTSNTETNRAEVLNAEKNNIDMMINSLVDGFSPSMSEDVLLHPKGHLGDQNLNIIASLQKHVSEMETEISRLKELLDKERKHADSETKKAETETRRANKLREMLKAGQSTADEQRRLVDVERKKCEEFARQLERLKCEADDARVKLVSESSKFKEVNKKLEAERKKLTNEKKRADEQQKIMELSAKNVLEEKQRADHLHQQVEEYQQKYDKLKKEMEETVSSKKVVEMTHARELKAGGKGEEKVNGTKTASSKKSNGHTKQKTNQARNCADVDVEKEAGKKKTAEMHKRQAMTEKDRTDALGQKLEGTTGRTNNPSKEIKDLVTSGNITDPSLGLIQKDMKAKSEELKLFKKRLKLEKERVKHANQVAELEKNCKKDVEEELHRIKLELVQFSNRVGLCSHFAFCNVGKSCLEKNDNETSKRKFMQTKKYPLHLQSGKEHLNPTCAAAKASEYFRPTSDCLALSLPMSRTCTESTSGTVSKMETMIGDSNRNKLEGSVIVPSMSSFSDRQVVGSLDKYDISNTKLAEKAKKKSDIQLTTCRLSSETNRTSYTAVVSANNVNSPLIVRNKDGNTRKRKRLLNATESIENLYTEGEKWHAKIAKNMSELHGVLGHVGKPLKEGMSSDYNQHQRKRGLCFEEASVRPCISIEGKDEPGRRTDENLDFNATENNDGEATRTCKDYPDKFGEKDIAIIERVWDGDYMRLLNLDSAVEEEGYRAAVAMPLSPALPNIEFESNQLDDVYDSRPSKINCSSQGLPSKEVNSNVSPVKRYVESSEIFKIGEAGKTNTMNVTSACVSHDQDSIAAMGVSDSGHNGSKISHRNHSGSDHDDSLYFVVFPEIRDNNSLFKIFHTTRTFNSQCRAFSQSDYVVKSVLSALSADEIFSPKEKVCVFFSLFLKSFSGIAFSSFNHVFDGNFLNTVDVFSHHLKKVMFVVETRTMFAEVCNLDELITLLQYFIIDGRVLSNANMSSETPSLSESKVDILVNNETVSLSLHEASWHQLVLGAVLLASVCAAFDRTDSIFEASYNISRITSSSMLTFLHVFAYICGDKLSANGDYSLIMTVIKSLVTYHERESLLSSFPSCTRCPFSDGAVSMEELSSLLLQRLSNYPLCVQSKGGITACSMHELGMDTYKSTTVPDDSLPHFCDVLSLLELLASKMSWGWVCENIIRQLFKLLEVCVPETPLTAVFVLLGQLARIGIDANGFQDAEVENIRVKLCSFISQSTSSKMIHFAAVNALLGTMPLSFQEVCKNGEEPPLHVSPSTPTACIQKWFSLLSDEQKSLSVKLLTADSS